MSTRRRGRWAAARAASHRALRPVAGTLRRAWRALRRRRGARVEVLLVDRSRCRALEREVRTTLRRLRRVLGPALPDDVAVIVQQVVRADRPMIGCYEAGHRADGTRFVLVRLALSVGARKLGPDEVLAALADQIVGVAELGPREVVPLESAAATPPAEPTRPAALRGDPLAARVDGHASRAA